MRHQSRRRSARDGLLLKELLLLEMVLLVLLCTSSYLSILLIEDAHDSRGYFVVYDSLVIFSDDINTEFLGFFQYFNKILLA